ncbi:MAG: cytochrome c biogenesis CcdA family protein [Deltaproteobacteria bacterium]|jgi:cytochrome c-type biogenesis protein|nr:cytochrome c biogenesis CcdA family protein [Deltaproteobacteria bacterium]
MLVFQSVDFPAAFLAGLGMFFTPCTLPLIPAWLSTVAGRNSALYLQGGDGPRPEGAGARARLEVFSATLAFTFGFSLIFTLLGAAASAAGGFLYAHSDVLRWVGAAAMTVFGLMLLGVIRPKALLGERRLPLPEEPAGLLGAFLVGMAFAAGWTPCGGPVLASLLLLASAGSGAARGLALLAVFSAGLAVPFLAGSLLLGKLLPLLKGLGRRAVWVNRALGILILALAVLLALDRLHLITPDS